MSEQVSRTLQVLWGEQPRRGPQRALSLDRIVEAGIAIADADGIAALSMARLADRLGSAPMSLYRHVSSKDELLIFMMDAAPGVPPALPPGWRAGLETWAFALRGVYYAHPWILQVGIGRPPIEPGQLAWMDRGLTAFTGTGLGQRERVEAIITVLNYVRGEAQIFAILLKGGIDPIGSQEKYAQLIDRFVRAERFPALAAAAEAGIFHDDGGEDTDWSFRFGLARILDGLELLVQAVSTKH